MFSSTAGSECAPAPSGALVFSNSGSSGLLIVIGPGSRVNADSIRTISTIGSAMSNAVNSEETNQTPAEYSYV